LGNVFLAQGNLREAIEAHSHAIAFESKVGGAQLAGAHNNLGTARFAQGKLADSISSYHRALQFKPDFAEAHSNLLLTLQYQADTSLSQLATAHAEFEQHHALQLRAQWRPHANLHDLERPLRLGFVSPDLAQHPVGYFLIGLLNHLDRSQCQTVCYSDRVRKDGFTTRLKSAATLWRDVHGISDQALAEQIRDDQIDILFDLAGHTAGNRLLVFARKPAPLQITWAGYAGTTGLKAMDYILADRYEIPPESEPYYTERVLRMPDGYVCYEPPADAPAVSPLPALSWGHVTFGSFNNPAKITSQVIGTWAQILKRLPLARLVLKYRGMSDASIVARLEEEFANQGIEPGRLECQGWSTHRELLAEYHRIDLALDPFPYGGGLTTCEALWMGVPVITCPGETFSSRHSLSHLSNAGLTETIAHNGDEYVAAAVRLGTDLPRLAALRGALRSRMASSPLCDAPRFAANLLPILRTAWRNSCHNETSVGNGL
jgi:predicted O-linked N-acetylglucosamine transferase (SPINDLY family)